MNMLRKDNVSFTFLVSDPILGIYWVPFISLALYVKSSNMFNQAYTF